MTEVMMYADVAKVKREKKDSKYLEEQFKDK